MSLDEAQVVREGAQLQYRNYGGSEAPVVIFQGLAGYAGEWKETARWLSQGLRVIAVDQQRGHRASEWHPADVSRAAAHVADVLWRIDQLALSQVILVGQSMGAHAAMLGAAAHPDRIQTLVMIEARNGGPTREGPARTKSCLDSWSVEFFGGGSRGHGWAAGLKRRTSGWWSRPDTAGTGPENPHPTGGFTGDIAATPRDRGWQSVPPGPATILPGETKCVARDSRKLLFPINALAAISREGFVCGGA